MTGKVIQGSFLTGQPRWSSSVQPKIAPPAFQAKIMAPPPTAFAPRPSQSPAPARAAQPTALQRHTAGGAFAVEAGALGIASGGGKPLPDAVRGRMEAALGADFSNVRVHVGPQAERIGAIAFTTGNDIYFAPGRYQPETIQGQQLLGHELAHVVQQRAGRVRNPLGSGLAVVQDRALEAEADRLGQRAATHRVTAQAKLAPVREEAATIQQARRGWRLLYEFGSTAGPTRGATPMKVDLRDLNPYGGLPKQQAPVPTPLEHPAVGGALEGAAKQQAATVPTPLEQAGVGGATLAAPLRPLTPKEKAALRQQTANQPATQSGTVRPKTKAKGTPVLVGVPDVGGYLNTIPTPNHATFSDIVIFSLNNNPGFNEIHVHRDNAGHALQISKKQTGHVGNGTPVPHGTTLFNAAANAAANF